MEMGSQVPENLTNHLSIQPIFLLLSIGNNYWTMSIDERHAPTTVIDQEIMCIVNCA